MPRMGLGAGLGGAIYIPAAEPATETHVFLLAGQSNMVGADTFDGGAGYPDGVQQYGYTESTASPVDTTLSAPTYPLDFHTYTAGNAGLYVQFSIDYVAATGANLVLVPVAKGGTGFSSPSEWTKGNTTNPNLYQDAVDAVNQIMSANPSFLFKGILWHQGEHDYQLLDYAENLHKMIYDMREDITVADQTTPFILGDLLDSSISSQTTANNQDVITATPDTVYNTAVASSTGLTDKGDSLHFSFASYRTLGSRYYTEFANLNNPAPTAEDNTTGHWLFGTGNPEYADLATGQKLSEQTIPPSYSQYQYASAKIDGGGSLGSFGGLLSDIDETEDLTMCVVFKYVTPPVDGYLIIGNLGQAAQGNDGGVSIFVASTGDLKFNERGGAGNQTIRTAATLTAGNWYFVAVSLSSTGLWRAYVGDPSTPTSISSSSAGRSLSTPLRKLSVGDAVFDLTGFKNTDFDVAEAIFFEDYLGGSTLFSIYSRSKTRLAARGITVV